MKLVSKASLGLSTALLIVLAVTSVFAFSTGSQHTVSAGVAEPVFSPEWATQGMAAPAVCRASNSTPRLATTTPAFSALTTSQPASGPNAAHDHHCYYELVEYCDYFDGGFEYCWYEWEFVCD